MNRGLRGIGRRLPGRQDSLDPRASHGHPGGQAYLLHEIATRNPCLFALLIAHHAPPERPEPPLSQRFFHSTTKSAQQLQPELEPPRIVMSAELRTAEIKVRVVTLSHDRHDVNWKHPW